MFSFMTETGTLALRLPADERESFLKKYRTKLCVQYNTVMKEYVEVPPGLLKKTRELKTFFDISYTDVAALKPKPTTRKKTAAGKKTARKKKETGTKTAEDTRALPARGPHAPICRAMSIRTTTSSVESSST